MSAGSVAAPLHDTQTDPEHLPQALVERYRDEAMA